MSRIPWFIIKYIFLNPQAILQFLLGIIFSIVRNTGLNSGNWRFHWNVRNEIRIPIGYTKNDKTDVIERAKGITTTTRTVAGTAVVEIERLNMYVALYFPGRHQLCKNSIFQHIHLSIRSSIHPFIRSFERL